MSSLDKELEKTQEFKKRSFPKLLHKLRRHFDSWAEECLHDHGYTDFKMMFMPFIMNIDPEGVTNNELAKRANVSKQAMSKVVKELEALDYICTAKNKSDGRSNKILLTNRGKELVVASRLKVMELHEKYIGLLGKKNFDQMLDSMITILAYHDEGGELPS